MLYIKFSPHSNLKISHQGAILVRISRFHTPDFFFSNVGFHVLANLDFSLSPFLTSTLCIPTALDSCAGISLLFSARFQRPKIVGDFAVFRPISTPGFVGWWQAGWIRPLQALLANITPPITAISYYISITWRARSILYCAAGNTTKSRNTEIQERAVIHLKNTPLCW